MIQKIIVIPFILFGFMIMIVNSQPKQQFSSLQNKILYFPDFELSKEYLNTDVTEVWYVEEEPEDKIYPIYDIPLSEELQKYTYDLCVQYNLSYELALSLMQAESSFEAKLVSTTNDYGLMQINKNNHQRLENELGISDFLDAKQNIYCGIYTLSGYCNKYPNTHMALMAYNMGQSGAKKLWDQGIYSTKYSRKIISTKENLELHGKLY